MESETASLPHTCSECGLPGTSQHGIDAGPRLHVWSTFSCDRCGAMWEADDYDEVPAELRREFCARNGTWLLRVNGTGDERLRALRALRLEAGLSPLEAESVLTRLPHVLATGTRTELSFRAARLSASGLKTEVVPWEE